MRSFLRVPASSSRRRGRIAAVAFLASAAVVGSALTGTAASAVTPPGHPKHTVSVAKTHALFQALAKQNKLAKSYKAGTYIVRLNDDPAATYTGNIHGYQATKPSTGHQLNAHTNAVKSYSNHLLSVQHSVASKYGVKATYNYTIAYNGFSAKLTAKQANALAKSKDVSTLVLDKRLKVQAATPIDDSHSSLNFLKIDTATGLWSKLGGVADAGKGVVLGDIDTGIAPENPSFAGDPLTDAVTASSTPSIIDGGGVDTVQYKKSDGNTFSSAIIPDGNGWTSSDLSTKIIAAHYFDKGFSSVATIATTEQRGEYLSPRDGAGHGSHTASTAAGDYGVDATVLGHDFGGISGVAPAAKIAVYKVCWDGPAADESQDGCDTSDIVAAINQATQDGVDVMNYSIGSSGGATTVYSPVDEAFLNAASAGIFVAAAAGNSGPGEATTDNAAPWETTVAASTIPAYEATVELGNGAKYVGASVSVNSDGDTQLSDAPLVMASSIPADGVSAATAEDCGTGTLSSAGAAGKIVICEREGVIARLEKSQTVKDAGGIGMILVNRPSSDIDSDSHVVPTIHIDLNSGGQAIETYATDNPAGSDNPATASFVLGNQTGITTTVPQIASFSSRGPVFADDSDVLKPDVAAPGVGILAAVANGPVGGASPDPAWDFYSGTSMATPHVAGLALDYLGHTPLATPSEIKSALMTTATNTVTSTGSSFTDPFSQGAGEVNPSSYLSPGLVYKSSATDWRNYLLGTGEVTTSTPGFSANKAIQPSNLNQPSIAIGNLFGSQTVTRTVISRTAGTYTASVSLHGFTTKVSPSTLKFTKTSQSKTFTVKFTRTSSAPLDTYETGFLTWKKSGSSLTVRSPLAINPTSIEVPAEVDSAGVAGSAKVAVTPGASLEVVNLPLLAQAVVTTPHGSPAYTDTATTGGHQVYAHSVEGADDTEDGSGSEFLKFNVHPVADAPTTDLDLYIAYYAPGDTIPDSPTIDNITPALVGVSATDSNDETVEYFPTQDQYDHGGTYLAYVDDYAVPDSGTNFAETFANLTDDSDGLDFITNPFVLSTKTAVKTSYTASWDGLDSNSDYAGVVFNFDGNTGNPLNGTLFDVSTEKPVVEHAPTISGSALVGSTLTAHAAVFDSASPDVTSAWLRDGVAIADETASTHVVTADDIGHKLSYQQVASVGGGYTTTTTSASTATVKSPSSTAFTFAASSIATSTHAALTVTVAVPAGVPAAAGSVTVKDGKTTLKGVLGGAVVAGTVDLVLPRLAKGSHKMTVTFNGDSADGIAASTSPSHTLTVR